MCAALAFAALALAAPVPAARAAEPRTSEQEYRSSESAGWLPGTRLFPSFNADPRRVSFSGGIRYDDDSFDRYRIRYVRFGSGSGALATDSHVEGKDRTCGAVSLGTRLPMYRWDMGAGLLQFDIEGSVWALFAFKRPSGWLGDASTLINADYWFAFPTSYRYGPLALQVRFWHMSSHLGDEFIVLYPDITRRNVSNEGVDLFVSWDIAEQVRVHAGVGCVYHSFKGAKFDPLYAEYGAEIRPFNAVRAARSLLFQPFLAAHLKNWQNNRFAVGGNYALGVEFTALRGQYRPKMQLYFSFHHGPSQEGQFYHAKMTWYGLTLSFELI